MKGDCPTLTGTGAEKQERHCIRSRAARLAQRAQMLFVFSPITLLHILSLLQFLLSLSVASSSTFTREKNKKGINKKAEPERMGGDGTAGVGAAGRTSGWDPGHSTDVGRGELQRSWDSENKPGNPLRQLLLREPSATKTLFLGGTEMSPPAGTQTQRQAPRLCTWCTGSVCCFTKLNCVTTRYRASQPPSYKAQGRDKAGLGSAGAPDRCSCNRPLDKRAALGLHGLWSTAQHQEVSSPLPAGLRSLVGDSASTPQAKASQESHFLISWKTLPGLYTSIPLLTSSDEHGCRGPEPALSACLQHASHAQHGANPGSQPRRG